MSVFALAIFMFFLPETNQGQEKARESVDCSKWSIKGLRLGMTLGEVRLAHKKLKRGRNWFRPDDRGRDWYFWAESRMHGVYNYVLPETDEDHAELISMAALIDMTETQPRHVVEALIERWGEPELREVPVGTVRYYNAFGAPRGEVEWKATTWQDEACDVLVTALDRPGIAYGLGTKTEIFMVSMDSISKLVAVSEQERKKALEATRP